MKRIKYNDYKWMIGYFGGATIGIILVLFSNQSELIGECTPTQSHQEVMATLSEIQQSLEMQISELPLSVECNK